MARYLGVRALLIIPTAWILVTLVFFLMRGIGDPITASAGGRLTPAQIAERKAAAGFDRPLLAQYPPPMRLSVGFRFSTRRRPYRLTSLYKRRQGVRG